MRVWFKKGVSLRNVQPQTVWAMERVLEVYRNRGWNCVYTSIWRAPSTKFSLHAFGYAFDTDTDKVLTQSQWEELVFESRAVLTDEYDVLAHDSGKGMHLHVEYDATWMDKNIMIEALRT
jgi:hypothetical protein